MLNHGFRLECEDLARFELLKVTAQASPGTTSSTSAEDLEGPMHSLQIPAVPILTANTSSVIYSIPTAFGSPAYSSGFEYTSSFEDTSIEYHGSSLESFFYSAPWTTLPATFSGTPIVSFSGPLTSAGSPVFTGGLGSSPTPPQAISGPPKNEIYTGRKCRRPLIMLRH